jgi:DNA replication protein DnaC
MMRRPRHVHVSLAAVPFDHRLYHFVLAFSHWEYACVVEEEARVTRCSTFTVRGVLYSAPSRLIGQRLKVRLYAGRLDCYLSGALVHSVPRHTRTDAKRLRVLDYRHFIDALKRKPQAFRHLVFRDDLFPRDAYRRAWEQLDARLSPRQACKTMVGLLELAARHGVEATLAERLDTTLAAGRLPDIERHRAESHLDPTKTLARFDFGMVPMVSKAHVMALAAGDAWLEKGANILLFGPPGGGKTHLAAGIGHALIEAGFRVFFTRTSEIVQKLQAARQSLQLPSLLTKLDRYDFIILDDISYVRKDQAETSVLFELIAERYERRSLMITANQPFSAWNEVFPDLPDQAMTVAAIPARASLDDLRVERRELPPPQRPRQQARTKPSITHTRIRRSYNYDSVTRDN